MPTARWSARPGASGGSGDEDEQICIAGIAAAGLTPRVRLVPTCACGIDVHAHVVPERFPAYLGRSAPSPWPETAPAPDANGLCHRHVLVGGKHYRTVSEKCWSAPRRLADFDAMGLAHQVLSPMPELLSYWLALADAQGLIRFLNEQTAAICADSRRAPARPGRGAAAGRRRGDRRAAPRGRDHSA